MRNETGKNTMATERRVRGDVVAAAFELLDEAGLEALTLREVARRLGVMPKNATQITKPTLIN